MKTHYINVLAVTKTGEEKEYFEPVTAMLKCFRFKGERYIKRIEGYIENEHPVVVGFDEQKVMLIMPGEVLEFTEEQWTRELHMRRGNRQPAARVA